MIIDLRDGISIGEIVFIISLLIIVGGSVFWLLKKVIDQKSVSRNTQIIDENRLVQPGDDLETMFPGLGFRNVFSIACTGAGIYICDPTYISDIYNSKDEISIYLRNYGSFLMDFGGDFSSPVWWQDPYVMIPLSLHYSSDGYIPPPDAKKLIDDIGVDSGSLLFLPATITIPPDLELILDQLIRDRNAALMPARQGLWTLFYEQFDPPQDNLAGLYRNIVIKFEGGL